MTMQLGMVLVLAVFCGVLGLQQWMIWRLRHDVVCLANALDLMNSSLKTLATATSIEPTKEQLDKVHAIVFQEIARQLEDDDEDAVIH